MKKQLTIEKAIHELNIASKRNPGPWVEHSKNVARASKIIAEKTRKYDPEKAYICGLLHDIGRRFGFSYMKHMIDGYQYLKDKDSDVASVCLTHPFPNYTIHEYQGEYDVTGTDKEFIINFLNIHTPSFYDMLIQLTDCLANEKGFVNMEIRFTDWSKRLGHNAYTDKRYEKIRKIRDKINCEYGINIEELLEIDSKAGNNI